MPKDTGICRIPEKIWAMSYKRPCRHLPNGGNATNFCDVTAAGTANNNNASNSNGVAAGL